MRLTLTLFAIIVATSSWAQPSGTDYFAEGKKAKAANNYALAIENFKKATEQKPSYAEAWYELGWCYNEEKKYNDAINALKNAKRLSPDEAKVFYESGYANDFGEKYEDAIADYKRCIELDSDYGAAYRQLANIYFDLDKDYANALQYYLQYIDRSAEKDISSKTWYKKGYSEIEAAQYDDAIASLKKSAALDPKYAPAYDEIGFAYYKLSQPDEAISAYTSSMRIDAKSSTPYSGTGDVFRYLKQNPEEAFNYYKKGVEINPKSQNCNFGVGWCYNDKSNYEAAIPYLKKTIEINPKYAAAFTELGYAYYGLKRYDEALMELNKSVKLNEGGVAYYYIGLCYIAKNQKEKAKEIHQKLVALNSKDAPNLLAKINAMP